MSRVDYRIPDLEGTLAGSLRDVRGIVSAYLFGSHAQGRPHRESDVDIGILLDRAEYPEAVARFELRVRLSSTLMGSVHRPVDVVILNDAPPLLGRHIISEGRRVLCTDAKADHQYVVYVLTRAADVAPWYRRYAKVKLTAIRG